MSFTVTVEKELVDNEYQGKISVPEVTSADQALLDAFGEPLIQIGGTVEGTDDEEATFPAGTRKLPSGFPFSFKVDGDAYEDPKAIANALITLITGRITTAITALRAKSDSFTGTTTNTV